MVVRSARVLLGRCRQMPRRSAGRHDGRRRVLATRAMPTGRCFASGTALPKASSSSPSCAARFFGSPRSTSPRTYQYRHPQQQEQRHGALAFVIFRRSLSFSPNTPDKKPLQQQQQEDEGQVHEGADNGVQRGNSKRRVSSGEWAGGREQGAEGASSSSSRRFDEEGMPPPMGQKESDRVWTVPNVITMGRIAFCPVLAGLIVTSQHELALAGLLAASLTDWLDGYIARNWNQKSVLGGFLDPLADKIMVTTVALALGQEGIIPAALVAVMVGRDTLLISGSLAYRYKTKRPEDAFFDVDSLDVKVTPSTLSKVNTALQFGTLWLGLTNAVYHMPGDTAFSALCAVTGVATVASGANYLLVSGLKPKGKLGKRLMLHRENLQERYREREVLVREKVDVGRERMRARQGELKANLRARRHKVAGALKYRISRRRGPGIDSEGSGKGGPLNRGD